jgi:hypothetical protein
MNPTAITSAPPTIPAANFSILAPPPAAAAELDVLGDALVVDAVLGVKAEVIVLFPTAEVAATALELVVKTADVVDDASGLTRFNVTPAAAQSLFAKSTVAIAINVIQTREKDGKGWGTKGYVRSTSAEVQTFGIFSRRPLIKSLFPQMHFMSVRGQPEAEMASRTGPC